MTTLTTSPLTQIDKIEITNVPDCRVDWHSEHFVLSAGTTDDKEMQRKCDQRLLYVAEKICPLWSEQQLSMHQLAEILAPQDISLWVANVEKTDSLYNANEFALWIHFGQQYTFAGDVLVQCKLEYQAMVH